jgi:hypothetical protein
VIFDRGWTAQAILHRKLANIWRRPLGEKKKSLNRVDKDKLLPASERESGAGRWWLDIEKQAILEISSDTLVSMRRSSLNGQKAFAGRAAVFAVVVRATLKESSVHMIGSKSYSYPFSPLHERQGITAL